METVLGVVLGRKEVEGYWVYDQEID